jgi:hypothetical protein
MYIPHSEGGSSYLTSSSSTNAHNADNNLLRRPWADIATATEYKSPTKYFGLGTEAKIDRFSE